MTILKAEGISATKRSVDEIFTEILEIARAEAGNRQLLEDKIGREALAIVAEDLARFAFPTSTNVGFHWAFCRSCLVSLERWW
jgi:hypothetical protein